MPTSGKITQVSAILGSAMDEGRVFFCKSASDTGYAEWYRKVRMTYPGGVANVYNTVTAAEAAATSNNNDTIVIGGHSEYTETAIIANDKNRVHYMSYDTVRGLNRVQGQSSKVSIAGSTATDTAVIRNTGVRCSFRGIKFTSSNTSTSALWAFEEGGEFTYFDNCAFVRSGVVTTTTAADLLMNGDSSEFHNCIFGYSSQAITANGNRPCVDLGREQITGKVCRDGLFSNCTFMRRANDSDNSFIYGSGATDVERMLRIDNPTFYQDALASANMDECISFGSSQTQGVVAVTGCVLATGTPASISTSVGVFIAEGSMDGTNPEAKIGIAIQCT